MNRALAISSTATKDFASLVMAGCRSPEHFPSSLEREPNMHLLYLVADGLSGRGLIIYGVGMALIIGVLTWATHIDHERNERRQGAKR